MLRRLSVTRRVQLRLQSAALLAPEGGSGFIEGGVTPIYAAATTTVFDAEIMVGYSSDVGIIGEKTAFDGAGSSRIFAVDGGRLKLSNLV